MAENERVPATKKDVAAVESSLPSQTHAFGDRLSKQMRDMQTELLKAIYHSQQDLQIQFLEFEVNTGNSFHAINEQMSMMERRATEIEKRLLMNPPAA
jgi:hypothetical protein